MFNILRLYIKGLKIRSLIGPYLTYNEYNFLTVNVIVLQSRSSVPHKIVGITHEDK